MGQQIFAVNSLGGFFTNNQLTKEVRHRSQPLQFFRQFAQPEPAAGKNRGNQVFFDKVSNISTQGGTLVETSTIPQNNYTITQGTLTITEYGNSIPFTQKLESLADVNVSDSIKKVLSDDQAKVLDSAAAAQYQASDYKATIVNTATTSFGSAGAAPATAAASMSDKNVRDIVDRMRTLNIPHYDNEGNYISIASTNAIRGLYDFFESKAQQTTMAPLMSGEVGTYYETRFVRENNVLSNTLGSTSLEGEAVFFGDDAVREGIAIMEEIRIKLATDYGRDQGLAWYYLGGFQKSWDFSSDGETRIIHVTSL